MAFLTSFSMRFFCLACIVPKVKAATAGPFSDRLSPIDKTSMSACPWP